MQRQVAIGAVVGFALTVLALAIWDSMGNPRPAPSPPPAVVDAGVAPPRPTAREVVPMKDTAAKKELRPVDLVRTNRQLLQRNMLQRLVPDGGH